jgi:8-oxo-dGTP diphosphatase
MSEQVISVVAALIRDEVGRVLLGRRRGTAFMQPGGKRDHLLPFALSQVN